MGFKGVGKTSLIKRFIKEYFTSSPKNPSKKKYYLFKNIKISKR